MIEALYVAAVVVAILLAVAIICITAIVVADMEYTAVIVMGAFALVWLALVVGIAWAIVGAATGTSPP